MIAPTTGYYNVTTTDLTTVIQSIQYLTQNQNVNGVIEFISVNLPIEPKQQPDWRILRDSLFNSAAFQRAVSTPNILNATIYGALQTILSTEGDLQYLTFCLQDTMVYLANEKSEINQILSDSNFDIQIV